MSINVKSVIFDIVDNYGCGITGVRSIEFYKNEVLYSLVAADFTAYSTTQYTGSYAPSLSFDTSEPQIGSHVGNAWRSNNTTGSERLIVVFNNSLNFDKIVINNAHNSGAATNAGIKNTKVTISPSSITDTTYNAAIADGVVLCTILCDEHVSSDVVDNQIIWERSLFDPALVPTSKQFTLTISKTDVDTNQTNFPVLVNLGVHVGKTDYDASSIFDELAPVSTKSVIFDIADCHGSTLLGVRCIEFSLDGVKYELTTSDLTGYATNSYTGHNPSIAFDTIHSKIDAHTASNSWLSNNVALNIRLIVVFDIAISFDNIILNNFHTNGSQTDIGIKNTKVTISPSSITDTTYNAAIADGTVIQNSIFPEHPTSNTIDNQIVYETDYNKKIALQELTNNNECYMEIERWDQVNKTAPVWAKIPSISSTDDTKLRLYYDKDCANNTSHVGDTGDSVAQNVWDDNFVAVYHMSSDPSGTAPQLLDSTDSNLDLTSEGSMTSTDLVDGNIGKGINLDGTNDALVSTANHGLTGGDPKTIEISVKNISGSSSKFLLDAGQRSSGRNLVINLDSSTNGLIISTSNLYSTYANTDITNTDPHNLVALFPDNSQANVKLYDNGVEQTRTALVNGTINTTDSIIRIGKRQLNDYYIGGTIDETRFSNTARSEDWIETTNESNNDNLITYSEFETASYDESSTDTINFTDLVTASVIGTITGTSSDTINFSDESSITKETNADSSDTINFSDLTSIAKIFNGISSDTINFSDTLKGNYLLSCSDSLNLSDSSVIRSNFSTTAEDTINFSEIYLEHRLIPVSASDTINLSTTTKLFPTFVTLDSFSFSDSSSSQKNVVSSAVSNFNFTDSSNVLSAFGITISDNIILSDNISVLVAYIFGCYDTIEFDDESMSVKVEYGNCDDSFNFSDSSLFDITYTVNASDSFTVSDGSNTIGVFATYSTDEISFGDNCYGTLPGIDIFVNTYDVVNFNYSSKIGWCEETDPPGEFGITDTATLTDITRRANSTDTLDITVTTNVQSDFVIEESNSLTLTDTARLLFNYESAGTDNLSITDVTTALVSIKNLKNIFKSYTKNGIDGSVLYTSSNGKSVIMHISATNTSLNNINIDIIVRRNSTNYYLVNQETIQSGNSFVINNNTIGNSGLTNNLIKDDEIIVNCTPSGNGDTIMSLIEL